MLASAQHEQQFNDIVMPSFAGGKVAHIRQQPVSADNQSIRRLFMIRLVTITYRREEGSARPIWNTPREFSATGYLKSLRKRLGIRDMTNDSSLFETVSARKWRSLALLFFSNRQSASYLHLSRGTEKLICHLAM